MNGDTGDAPALTPPTTATTTPVRRSARTRKPNSRFADDEVDSCFKKIVSGLASPEATPAPASILITVPAPTTGPAVSLSRPRKAVGRRKDSRSEERSEEVEGRGERGRKDSKEDERSEELEERSDKGRKLSEGSEEKSERKKKEKSEELEEGSEQGKKVRQNEQQTEDLEEKREKRRKTSETEERDDRRRRKDSQSDSSGEKREKPFQAEGKSASHSLSNGLEAEEEGDECFRVTRSGRREEDPRRKIRKRGKGKEEEEKEAVAEDDRGTAEPVTHERSETIQGASCTPAVLPTSVCDSENGDSDREGIAGPRKGACGSPAPTDGGVVETSTGVEGRVCQSGGRDTASLKDAEHILPCQEKDKVEGYSATQREVRQRGEGVCVTATTKPAAACKTNGDTDGGSLYTTQRGNTTPTTNSTTTTPATATTATTTITTTTITPTVTTATTTITVVTTTTVASTSTATTIAAISSPTTITTSHPKQTPQEPAPPPAPSEVPKDPRFHRGACGIPVELVGSSVPPQTQGTTNLGAIPSPSRPPPPPDTLTEGKEGVIPAQGSRQNSRDSGKDCQGSVGTVPVLKTVKLLCENIPLPQTPSPSSFSSPKHNTQGEEALSKAGGKRERRGKEESTTRPWKAEEQEELCSPESKRRKQRDGEKREEGEEREESKDDETKRKRVTDNKEEDKRKRRKVEEAEEKESTPKISPIETPLPFSLADIKVPPPPAPLSAPASAPPLPPSPRKLTTAPQNSPRGKREFLTSPRAERESHKKDSPKQNWESHRSESATLVQEKELPRDLKDGKDTGKGSKDSPSSSKDAKGGRETVRSEREVSKDSKDSKGGRETVRSEREVSKDSKDFKGGKDALKSEKEPLKDHIHLSRCEVDPGKGERAKDEEGGCQKGCEGDLGRGRLLECARNTGRSREDSSKGDKEAIRGKQETPRGDREPAKGGGTVISERNPTKSEEDPVSGKEDSLKSERESVKEEKDSIKTEKDENEKEETKGEKEGNVHEKYSSVRENQAINLSDIPFPSDTPTTNTPAVDPRTGEDHVMGGMFLSSQGSGAGIGVFMGLSSTSSTAIPFLEDTPSNTSECEIPGLSILASSSPSSHPLQRTSPGKDQSHRSWFAIGGHRRNQRNGQTDTQNSRSVRGSKEAEESQAEKTKEEPPEEPEDTSAPMEIEEETKEDNEGRRQVEVEEREARNRAVVEERLQSFIHVKENVFVGERKRSKRNKEVRRMVCDCSLTKEETARGEVGCGEDCLNRLLMIECGSRCPLGDRCMNKRFLNREYGDVEVFNAEEKGCGLRASSDLPPKLFMCLRDCDTPASCQFMRHYPEAPWWAQGRSMPHAHQSGSSQG